METASSRTSDGSRPARRQASATRLRTSSAARGADRNHRSLAEGFVPIARAGEKPAVGIAGVDVEHGDTAKVMLWTNTEICDDDRLVVEFVGAGPRARVVRMSSDCLDGP